jgi:hypothetical protein
MGQGQSRADVSPSKTFKTSDSTGSTDASGEDQPLYPDPSGHEYDAIDKLQAELPTIIDEESQQQVDDYIQACDGGKGPMVACFATGEYISMFERKVSAPLLLLIFHFCLSHPLTYFLMPRTSTKKLLICLRMFAFDR